MRGSAGLAGTPAQLAPLGTVSPFITCTVQRVQAVTHKWFGWRKLTNNSCVVKSDFSRIVVKFYMHLMDLREGGIFVVCRQTFRVLTLNS
jgi:hypothetical protein